MARRRTTKPVFQGVVDLGLRDVGVKNEPRRHAAYFGTTALKLFPLAFLSVFVTCAVIRASGAEDGVVLAFGLLSTAVMVAVVLQMSRRSPMLVLKVTAEGTNQVMWLFVPPLVLFALAAALTRDPLMIPMVALTGLMALLARRGRGRVPEVLQKLRPLLAADESVLGDGVGVARWVKSWNEVFRLVVATDRRVLVATSGRSIGPFLVVDAPYERVSRFGIEWRFGGRIGVLSLTVAGVDGASAATHVISSIAPANLVSIARALQSHGVPVDDSSVVAEAEQAWEETLRRGRSRTRLRDRAAAMHTRDFDLGLWLLLAVSAAVFYVNPLGIGFGVSRNAVVAVMLVVPVVCIVCGYLSRTKWSLAYLVPLNLLVSPAFFFAEASTVITVMIVLSSLATLGLWAGAALREAADRRADAVAEPAASPETRPARGSLRFALSGLGLIRITGILLALMVALVAATSAAGFELPLLRLAVDELTLKQVRVDGRSNLTGNAASVTYTPGTGLHEFITDQHLHRGPNDGARWELRSSWTDGFNEINLAHYVFEPQLDNPSAIADFVARKDREHYRLAGFRVTHTERVVDGRRGYVWNHGSLRGYWFYAAWFPQPVDTVRVECIAKDQKARFKRLCAEAIASLEFH